jgi:hypothetical protein
MIILLFSCSKKEKFYSYKGENIEVSKPYFVIYINTTYCSQCLQELYNLILDKKLQKEYNMIFLIKYKSIKNNKILNLYLKEKYPFFDVLFHKSNEIYFLKNTESIDTPFIIVSTNRGIYYLEYNKLFQKTNGLLIKKNFVEFIENINKSKR